MMSDTFCGYDPGKRDEVIVGYVYGELAADERTLFTRHLTRCLVCRQEIEALGDLRADLAAWSPPVSSTLERRVGPSVATEVLSRIGGEFDRPAPVSGEQRPPFAIAPAGSADRRPRGERRRWSEIPVWAQFAAAMLCVGVAAGIANLHVTYDNAGLVVRTGWSDAPRATAEPGPAGSLLSPVAVAGPAAPPVTAPELAAVAEQLRAEFQDSLRQTPVSAPMTEEAIARLVRTIVKESEQRQQRELALRVAEVAQDAQVQRQADLVRIDRTLGALTSTTGTAVRRQEQLLNNLAVRVSQRQ